MEEEILSIIAKEKEIEIEANSSDRLATLIKGVIGIAPYVGPILAEAIASIIPNQKLDRIITFVKILNDQVQYIEKDILRIKIQTEEFADLLEDGINQAARALSDERKQYIASLLKNSLSGEKLSHIEEKELLSLLGELNDIEIILLKHESLSPMDKERTKLEIKHDEILLRHTRLHFNPPQEVVDRNALLDSYMSNLFRLGLLKRVYPRVEKGEVPEFDEETGMIRTRRHKVSALGYLLLRYIDL
jgi:hypothetical protein